MQGCAFIYHNNNSQVFVPSMKEFTSTPSGTVVYKCLKSISVISYDTSIFSTYSVPTIEVTIENRNSIFLDVLRKSRYLRRVKYASIVEFTSLSDAFEFTYVFSGTIDSYNYSGTDVFLVVR